MSRGVALLLASPLFCSLARGSARFVLVLAMALCGLGSRPSVAAAESLDDARARAHFAAGQEYYAQELYVDAVSEFDQAYQLSGRPEMLINRARAEERAGVPDAALASFELLLERHPLTSYREEALQHIERLRAELGTSAPPEKRPAAAPPPVIAEAPAAPPAASEPQKRDWKLWPPRLPTLIVGGALVASVLVSVGTGWAAHAKHNDLDARCKPDSQCPDDARSAGDRDDKQRGRTLAAVSTGFTFASIALAAATSVLWAYDVKAQQKARVSLGVGASWASAHARLRVVY